MTRTRPVLDRLMARTDKAAAGGCWEWQGSKDVQGYGRINIGNVPRLVHRVAYELLVGPIPEGLELDHQCVNPPCLNPAHMAPVTHAENMARTRRSTCKRGHVFTDATVYTKGDGSRECAVCKVARRVKARQAVAS